MLLITGPAGSGKTAYVLAQLRESLKARDWGARLLVPTKTLAQHLQNRIAREGFVLRTNTVQTLSEFVSEWAGDIPRVPDAVFELIVQQAVARAGRPEFARVAHLPGFCASMARTIGDFSSSGCDATRLARHLPDAMLAEAFLAVYEEVERELGRRGMEMRARKIERAAERIAAEGMRGVGTVWLDGFYALPDPELKAIAAMGRHAELTLTFEALDERLRAMGFRERRLPRSRPTPVMALMKAPGIEREAEEIARRIVEQAEAGRPFREMGIVVRAKESYVPVLRSTLERFGIPAHFYFDEPLNEHPAIRFLTGAIEAMQAGWDHAGVLATLRLAPALSDCESMDRFEFKVREQIPNRGLEELRALTDDAAIRGWIDELGALERWRAVKFAPGEWARELETWRALFRPVVTPHSSASMLRRQSVALRLYADALGETAMALDAAEAIDIAAFTRALQLILRRKPLRVDDDRRNVVHVLSAPEARQWVLPVVFVCGMVEKEFPQFHKQDLFFPDAARRQLNAAGIRVRTAADFEREERALFDTAVTRATLLVTLSYPEFDRRGDRNLPSLYLEDLTLAAQESRNVRPLPRGAPGAERPVEIRSPHLLQFLREKTQRISPSGLEAYLQCPFKYFAGRVLYLKPAPVRPEKRLDFLTQGNIVHDVLAGWWDTERDVEEVFERVFAAKCEEKRVPYGYHAERMRNQMLDDLRDFARDVRWPRGGCVSEAEKKFAFPLEEGLTISGRIDRLDRFMDGSALVVDYKYSRKDRVKEKQTDESLLQAPLYMMGAEHDFQIRPTGMYYIGLKGGIVFVGWSEDPVGDLPHTTLPENWRERAKERTLQAVREIRGGRIEVKPEDMDGCRICDYRDVCRVNLREGAEEAEAAQ